MKYELKVWNGHKLDYDDPDPRKDYKDYIVVTVIHTLDIKTIYLREKRSK